MIKKLIGGVAAGRLRTIRFEEVSGIMMRFNVCALLLCFLISVPAPASAQVGHDFANASGIVTGPVHVTAEDDDVIGIQVMGSQGKEISVAVTGDIFAEAATDHYDHQGVTGLYVDISGRGSTGTVNVHGNVTSVNTWNGENPWNLDTAGFEVDVSDRGKADVTVNGDVLSRSVMIEDNGYTWSAGLHSGNSGGDLKVTVNGSVKAVATTYSVGLNMKIDTKEEASSFVQVNGDITARDIGIRVENFARNGTMELLLDGTLSAERCISPEGDFLSGNRFTVWKAEPLQGVDIVPPDEDIGITAENARTVEKEIQYIIRTEKESAPYITVRAENYHGFPVALEEESVPVQVHAPDGYKVAAVYGKPGNKMQLRQDRGVYILTVPKGGGIELSVSLEKAIPLTGDSSSPFLWMGLILLGLTGLIAPGRTAVPLPAKRLRTHREDEAGDDGSH